MSPSQVLAGVFVSVCLLFLGGVEGLPGSRLSTEEVADAHIEHVLEDPELVAGYFKCIMNEGPCTAGGEELKKILPDAIGNDCAICSEIQKTNVHKILQAGQEKKPALLKEFLQKLHLQEAFEKFKSHLPPLPRLGSGGDDHHGQNTDE